MSPFPQPTWKHGEVFLQINWLEQVAQEFVSFVLFKKIQASDYSAWSLSLTSCFKLSWIFAQSIHRLARGWNGKWKICIYRVLKICNLKSVNTCSEELQQSRGLARGRWLLWQTKVGAGWKLFFAFWPSEAKGTSKTSWSISASVPRTEPARCLTMTSVLRSTFWYPAGCSTMPLGFVYTPWICRTLSFLFSCAHSSTCTKWTVPETSARADSSAANKLLRGYSLLRSSASPVLGLASYLFKRWIMCCQKDNFGEASQRGSFFFMLHLISSRGPEYNSLYITACSGSLLHVWFNTSAEWLMPQEET